MDPFEWKEMVSPEELPILKEKCLALSLLGIDSSEVFFNCLFFLYQRAGRLKELGIESVEENFLCREFSLIKDQTLTDRAKEGLRAQRKKEMRRRMAIRLFKDPQSIRKDPLFIRAREEIKGKVQILTFFDQDFPQKLLEIPDPPSVLYLRGNRKILNDFSITIVGTRKASQEGTQTAREISYLLAQEGTVIVSGLALGIDGIAHRGALEAGGKTIAVLPCGMDQIYPTAHEKLAIDILNHGGALLTEFPPKSPPLKIHFHRRNRLLSGLSLGTIVIEAAQKSGTMITSHCAADQGRDVFAVPGSIYRPTCQGSNQLIKDGARLISSVEDIFLAYPEQFKGRSFKTEDLPEKEKSLSEEGKILYSLLIREPLTSDELLEKTGLSIGKLWKELTRLEINQMIFQGEDGRFLSIR